MELINLYLRGLKLLGPESWRAWALAIASIALAIVQLAEPILFGRVVDALSNKRSATDIIGMWAAIGLFGILAGVVVAVYADRMAHRRRLAVMSEAFERAITLPLSYHAERGSSAVVSAIQWGSDSLFWLWLRALREQLTAFVGILFLVPTAIHMDYRMALILAGLAIAYTFLNMLAIKKTSTGQNEVERLRYDVSSRVGDVLGNVTVVQSFNRLQAEADAMRGLTGMLLTEQYPVLTWWGILTVLQRAAATITMVAVFAVGAVLSARGELSVGEIVSFVAFAGLLIGKLDAVSGFVTSIHQGAPTLRTFFNLLDEKSTILEKPDAKPLLEPIKGAVRFDHVSFQFPKSPQGVFGIDFNCPAGKTLALVGPTGSGKTTTLGLLQRLRAPASGRILIDDQDISDITLASLRHSIGVVFQDAGLFNRSIADNIRIGRPDATAADIERAARLAEAHEFIMRKEGGYNFVIGERGSSLSGGERQRIAVARAILKDAPILILDEATSALDAETEAKIKRALDALRKNRTTFIIAHRLSTVANADEIVVLDQGRIVERGTFRSLVADKGLFARMVAEGGFTVPTEVEAQEPMATAGRVDA